MLGRVYIKNKEIFMIYEYNLITKRTGVIYDIGHHLTNLTWFDMNNIREEFKKYVDFIIDGMFNMKYPSVDAFHDKLDLYAEELDKSSPYLHFYTQALYEFILRYYENKVDAFSKLIYATTDCIEEINKVQANIAEEHQLNCINRGVIDRNVQSYECTDITEMYDGAYMALAVVLLDIDKKRKRLVEEFDYIMGEKESLKDTTAWQRLYLLDLKRKNIGKEPFYTNKKLSSFYLPTTPRLWKKDDFNMVKDILINENIEIVQMYEVFTLDNLMRFELLNIITEDLILKKCKYCGCYFVPVGRSDKEYCSRIFKDETKPCNEIGAMKVYENGKAKDDIYAAYRKIYRRMHSRVKHNKMTQTEFYNWNEDAKKKRDDCQNGVITPQEFVKWLGE